MTAPQVDLYAIKARLGGKVYAGGRRGLFPGPGHSRRDEGLSVYVTDDGKALIHSFTGDPLSVCAPHLGIERHTADRLDRAGYDRLKRERQAEAARRQAKTLAFCQTLWNGGVEVEGSPGARYLDARGIDWFPADVLFHPNAPRGYSTSATGPALLSLARSVTGSPKAVQATFLRPDCRTKIGRVTFGTVLGAAVRLSPVNTHLAVAEGMETAASYAELEGVPTWATLGTANLEAFNPPSVVRRLTIAADGDDAGLKAAYGLAERLRSRCEVAISAAPSGRDWNDMVRGDNHA